MADTTYTIDATDKKLGRIATEAATVLMGKHVPGFRPNKEGEVSVTIKNASKLSITDKKLTQKQYANYSGYPGGLSQQSLRMLTEKKGFREALRKAIKGMLPKNKLQTPRMKRLHVTE